MRITKLNNGSEVLHATVHVTLFGRGTGESWVSYERVRCYRFVGIPP
jgi:hypothetical protein